MQKKLKEIEEARAVRACWRAAVDRRRIKRRYLSAPPPLSSSSPECFPSALVASRSCTG